MSEYRVHARRGKPQVHRNCYTSAFARPCKRRPSDLKLRPESATSSNLFAVRVNAMLGLGGVAINQLSGSPKSV